jgi:hypothetical protein
MVTNSLNGGIDELAITTSTSGGSSGHPFDGVIVENGASLVFDNARVRGTSGLSARHTLGPNQNAYYAWNRSVAQWSNSYGRVYVWFDRLPTGDLRLIRGKDSTGLAFAIDVLRNGVLRARDRSNRTITQTTASINTGRWVRIEWRVDTTSGQIVLRLFNDANSTTATETASSGSGQAISSSINEIHIGRSGTQGFSASFWTDDPAMSTYGWIGPAA